MAAEAWLHDIDQDLTLAIVDDDDWPLASPVRAILATRWPSLPIVVMMHGGYPRLGAKMRELGAAEVLVKPFELLDLVETVECLTGVPHARTQPQMAAAMR